jgi:hypothetical protein
MEKFIGISKIWYGNVFSEAVTAAKLKAWLAANTTTEVKNSHDGTWGYTQDDPSVTDYINELTGKPYHRDKVSDGNKTITWTSGAFEFADKANLQGGSSDATHWESGKIDFINKGVVAKTKTGNYIVFTNADIIAKADQQDRAIGLGVTAVALENETEGVADEYWFKGSAIDTTSGSGSGTGGGN